jgi:hypothetical protein
MKLISPTKVPDWRAATSLPPTMTRGHAPGDEVQLGHGLALARQHGAGRHLAPSADLQQAVEPDSAELLEEAPVQQPLGLRHANGEALPCHPHDLEQVDADEDRGPGNPDPERRRRSEIEVDPFEPEGRDGEDPQPQQARDQI